jgi:hypothetical protein
MRRFLMDVEELVLDDLIEVRVDRRSVQISPRKIA